MRRRWKRRWGWISCRTRQDTVGIAWYNSIGIRIKRQFECALVGTSRTFLHVQGVVVLRTSLATLTFDHQIVVFHRHVDVFLCCKGYIQKWDVMRWDEKDNESWHHEVGLTTTSELETILVLGIFLVHITRNTVDSASSTSLTSTS